MLTESLSGCRVSEIVLDDGKKLLHIADATTHYLRIEALDGVIPVIHIAHILNLTSFAHNYA